MKMICKNCGNQFEGNYCNECGQKAKIHKINPHFILYDIQVGFFSVDRGVLYTIRQLFTRPGYAIKEYIDGKRVVHFRPFTLLVVLTTIQSLAFGYFHFLPDELVPASEVNELSIAHVELKNWLNHHLSLMVLLSVPVYAAWSLLVFRDQRFNFSEYMVINAFIGSQRFLIALAILPIVQFLGYNYARFHLIFIFFGLVMFCWTYWQLFPGMNALKKMVQSVLVDVVTYFSYRPILAVLTVLWSRIVG